MLKKVIKYLLILSSITILLPFLMVKLLPSQEFGFFFEVIILFLVINPFVSIVFGYLTGKNNILYLPFMHPILFVIGCRINFGWGNTDFLVYGGIYLMLGYISAGITYLVMKYNKKGE